MKVAILAGGLGSRLQEETEIRPKPMVEIGGRPILWHIMKHYSRYGFDEFVLALGYKGDLIKRYFLDYHALGRDMTISLENGHVEPLSVGGASILSSTTRADGFVIVGDDSEGYPAGAEVDVWLYA